MLPPAPDPRRSLTACTLRIYLPRLSASVEAPVAVAVSAEVEAGVVGSAVVVPAEWEGGGQVGFAALGPGVEVVDLGPRERPVAAADRTRVVGQR